MGEYSAEVEQRVHPLGAAGLMGGFATMRYMSTYDRDGAQMMLNQLRDRKRECERYIRAALDVGTADDRRRADEEMAKVQLDIDTLRKQIFKQKLGTRDWRMDRRLERQRRALRNKHLIHCGAILAFFTITPLAIALISLCWHIGILSVFG